MAVIHVGANTEAAMKEKKERVEDAISATRAAVEEGIVPGGGVAYLRASQALKKVKLSNKDEKTGVEILARALTAPTKQIASNSGHDGEVVVETVKGLGTNEGFDAVSESYGDMLKAGVVDPLKVARLALENASSIASLLVSTQAVICKLPEKENKSEHEDHMD